MGLNFERAAFNFGLKFSCQELHNITLNFDFAKSNHLIFGGVAFGIVPLGLNAGCILAFDSIRNCLEKEETKFTAGLFSFSGYCKPASSPSAFPVFTFEEFHQSGVGPALGTSISASKRLDDKLLAGISIGYDSLTQLPGVSAIASYDWLEDVSTTFFFNHKLSFGAGITKQINAYYFLSCFASVDELTRIRIGFNVDYKPDPPLLDRIKYKIKEFRTQGESLHVEAKKTFEGLKMFDRL